MPIDELSNGGGSGVSPPPADHPVSDERVWGCVWGGGSWDDWRQVRPSVRAGAHLRSLPFAPPALPSLEAWGGGRINPRMPTFQLCFRASPAQSLPQKSKPR